jgi:hypothetical protein
MTMDSHLGAFDAAMQERVGDVGRGTDWALRQAS